MIRFDDFIKEKRLAAKLSLRQFCQLASVDPSNWSKIERGLGEIPKSRDLLESIATIFELTQDDRNTLFDLALVASIPKDFRDEKIIGKLPIFFKTVRGEKPTETELKKLFEALVNS